MAAYQSPPPVQQGHAAVPRQFPAFNPVAATNAPAGTFLPGTKVQVGGHRVVVEKYLSEGGFAHVYVVRLPKPVNGTDHAVLKRVAVPDKAALASMRTEVETMKKLKGHKHIVRYIDSHASQLQGGGYEVFLLMEYCAGGGLIDFMNTRLQNRLTEPEIVKIFSDVAEGVACMHYLKPPLLHRDLKVENVLISRASGSTIYKLCDFGSAAAPRPAATSAAEGRLIEDDVQRHTTIQYRSPEMIDVYRKQPIDEKSDIWALGVFLYKLCYYTTPFEEVGQMAILNASYKFPAYPQFSDRLKMLIATMLMENPQKRPNIYEVVKEICDMQGKIVPIRDIYSHRTASEARRNQELPSPPVEAPAVGATFSPPIQETQIIPEIAPMRRGRPGKSQPSAHSSAKPSPSPLRDGSKHSLHDPFAALDGSARKHADELSNRFPTLDQFDILHEKGDTFAFEPSSKESKSEDEDLSQRLTNALADDAFGQRSSPERQPPPTNRRSQVSPVRSGTPQETVTRQQAPLYQPKPQRPQMVSTGTMTSPSQTPRLSESSPASRPIYRFPAADSERRPSSQVRAADDHQINGPKAPSPPSASVRPEPSHRLSSDRLSNQSHSARPSLEGIRRPSGLEVTEPVSRSKSAISKVRPVSVQASMRYDYSREPETSRSSLDLSQMQYEGGAPLRSVRTELDRDPERANITSDMDYLRAKEEEESLRKREKRSSSGAKHAKRGSLQSLSLSGSKTLFAGRFGEAFRRFESTNGEKTSSPTAEDYSQQQKGLGSDVSPLDSPPNERAAFDTGDLLDDLDREDISPEMRRELERRRLSQEEKRVANAAAEYRRRVAEGGDGGGQPRSRAIMNRMQNFLGESNKPQVAPKTATGYGKYTDSDALQAKPVDQNGSITSSGQGPISRAPGPIYGAREGAPAPATRSSPATLTRPSETSSPKPASRPAAPPKPKSLRMGGQDTSRPGTGHAAASPASPGEDWEENFSRRFPSLSGLEMETEIEVPHYSKLRTREV
ncbi:Uncharacterized protein PECH_004763 [Penicillium ucsense]|uniref:non-specific serine/threonine protein kinase n=1 Tax=Penicillium ucsense TaxID=2839758 RepID=A0A8J8WM42_9EURO|nr:Uncharacterized protein PECM_007601 [Penicillium ucsense]KAF7739287.1 Uncharacterized protein PECH_004763 [Penicillium ucsense]